MADFNDVMKTYLGDCTNKGYTVSKISDENILVTNGSEEVELVLTFDEDKKLKLDFYKNEQATDEYVNTLMSLFAEVVNREQTVS